MIKLTEKNIQYKLWYLFNSHRYRFLNIYFFNPSTESDFVSFYKSGYCQEVEVKTSVSDFKADFKKKKHRIMIDPPVCHPPFTPSIPNRFYFAVPEYLINVEDVPEYAGLIYLSSTSTDIVKNAPLLHKIKIDHLSAFNKMYYSYEQTTTLKLRELK